MKKSTLLLVFLFGVMHADAQQPTVTNIDINNIDATISSSSDLFWDFSSMGFEVPKGSNLHAIFAGGLWMGGMDNGGNLYAAAQTYRQTGFDFQPGPIDTVNGNIPTNPLLWNTSWKLNQSEIDAHIQQVGTPNYIVPQNIASWPGYNASLGRVLAPFADTNGNGIYDPQNGDYPYIMGDQTVYSIFNDMAEHTESDCDTMGIEIHRTFYGFDQPANTALNNTIFSRYEFKNYSNTDYQDVYFTLWTDFDLGNYNDDYVGTDIGLDMKYAYNADADDEGPSGYGLNPPAIGVYFLNATLFSTLVYDNINGVPNGNPTACADYRNFAKAIWADNQPLTYGGDGRNPGNPVTTFMYPDTTNTVYYPAFGAWNEAVAGNPAGDRRMLGTIGPFTLPAQGYFTFDAGYTFSRATSGGPLASLAQLQYDVSQLRMLYNSGVLTAINEQALNQESVNLYPNPAVESVSILNPSPGSALDIFITDVTGKTVYETHGQTTSKLILHVNELPSGIYIVHCRQGANSYKNKLIKL